MEVWPPPPTHNAEPPPPEGAPRRRLLTKHRWLDVLLGVLAGAVSCPIVIVVVAVCFRLAMAFRSIHLVMAVCNTTAWVLVALLYALLYRARSAFAGAALAVTVLVWLPFVIRAIRTLFHAS